VAQEAVKTLNVDVGQVKNNLPFLCSCFLSVEITDLMPQASNTLQYSLVRFSCLSIQVKWTTAASFDQNNMKQLEHIFEQVCIFNMDLGPAYIFFLYHTILTKFWLGKRMLLPLPFETMLLFFLCFLSCHPQKISLSCQSRFLWCGVLGNSIEKANSTICTRQSGQKANYILATSELPSNHYVTSGRSGISLFLFWTSV